MPEEPAVATSHIFTCLNQHIKPQSVGANSSNLWEKCQIQIGTQESIISIVVAMDTETQKHNNNILRRLNNKKHLSIQWPRPPAVSFTSVIFTWRRLLTWWALPRAHRFDVGFSGAQVNNPVKRWPNLEEQLMLSFVEATCNLSFGRRVAAVGGGSLTQLWILSPRPGERKHLTVAPTAAFKKSWAIFQLKAGQWKQLERKIVELRRKHLSNQHPVDREASGQGWRPRTKHFVYDRMTNPTVSLWEVTQLYYTWSGWLLSPSNSAN